VDARQKFSGHVARARHALAADCAARAPQYAAAAAAATRGVGDVAALRLLVAYAPLLRTLDAIETRVALVRVLAGGDVL
jgi:hypothetical protein